MSDTPFGDTEWSGVPTTRHDGGGGFAMWRARNLEGEMETELADGRVFKMAPGTSYQVADGAEPHRSSTRTGAKLFIED